MLLTIEKVLILKTVSIFADTPEEILADVAALLEEVDVTSGRNHPPQGRCGPLYVHHCGRAGPGP